MTLLTEFRGDLTSSGSSGYFLSRYTTILRCLECSTSIVHLKMQCHEPQKISVISFSEALIAVALYDL